MQENLSQDELDKLLAGMDSSGGEASEVDDGLSNDEFTQLEDLYAAGWAQLASNMSQSLGQSVTIDFGVASMVGGSTLSADAEGLGVFVHFSVTVDTEATHGIVLQADEVGKFGALIAGEDPGAGPPSAEQLQGVQDFLDMSLPILAGEVGRRLGGDVQFGAVQSVNAADPSADLDVDALGLGGALVRLEYALSIGDVVTCPLLYTLPLAHARELLARAPQPESEPAPAAVPEPRAFAAFDAAHAADARSSAPENLELILDIQLEVVARLGSVQMPIREILKLGPGSIIDIDRLADAPVELVVNDKLVARGDVVVVQENFGLKISEVQSPQERIASLRP